MTRTEHEVLSLLDGHGFGDVEKDLPLALLPHPVSSTEQDARRRWLAGAVDHRFASCWTCGRVLDDHGNHLMVARQARSRRFECIDCWDAA